MEKLEGVFSDLLRSGLVLALGTGSDHAGLKEDTLKHDIVLSQVVENLSPNLLSNFKCPVDSMLTIKQDLWLHNWYQPVVLPKVK